MSKVIKLTKRQWDAVCALVDLGQSIVEENGTGVYAEDSKVFDDIPCTFVTERHPTLKTTLTKMLKQVVSEIQTVQKFNAELTALGLAHEINQMKLHFLDGKFEALTQALTVEPRPKAKP